MNNSNPLGHYVCGPPRGVPIAYSTTGGAPNPYQNYRPPSGVPGASYPMQPHVMAAQPQQIPMQAPPQPQQSQQQQQQSQQQPQPQPQPQQPQPARGRVAVEGPYGLLALPNLIQHSANTDKSDSAAFSYLTRGFELNSLGINVAQQRPLHPTLASVALERPEVPVIPEYRIPECYKQAKPRQPTLKLLQKYKNDTLFYIFYSMPRDLLQLAAARVLLERGWWYHKVRQQWMRKKNQNNFEFFNQNTWKMEAEENFQPNSTDIEKDLSDPAHTHFVAALPGANPVSAGSAT
ncbi:putative NOT2 NOT3 NOT5 family [Trypanosoma vivax]|uniref:NOT2/NOT3/NOT5 C-terminal domain-containing protein n=1 Tax=Trypanosoma vivax (strain Y486) TaxID=1055687 RepID=G0TWA0_TRYVY|nr:hypothetical protein TRVL_07660 [Trypanosoma vivax]KAH8604061.1 putative NOT2 NOT3 NOT5 family [Trypanosoma vivax]CCC48238.1 conserved hypothetical protein [Trypanosoma vivax Y486]